MATSSMPTDGHSPTWTHSFAGDCARYCASRKSDRGWDAVKPITNDGQMRTSRIWDCSPWHRPEHQRANPDEETTNWRAVCGKTARTVRREGRTGVLLYPYQIPGAMTLLELRPRCEGILVFVGCRSRSRRACRMGRTCKFIPNKAYLGSDL